MKMADYEALVLRLEKENERNPSRYRFRLGLLAVLGYAYLGVILALLVVLMVGLVLFAIVAGSGHIFVVQLVFVMGALAWFVISVLMIRLDPPSGRLLTREEAPQLFDEVDSMCDRLKASSVDRILVDGALNASMSRVPRFGLLGWDRSFLVLGVPILAALSPDELRSVIAHELGHHSRAHGRFGVWKRFKNTPMLVTYKHPIIEQHPCPNRVLGQPLRRTCIKGAGQSLY